MEKAKCLEIALTNYSSLQEEIKSRLKSGNACYHLVQNLLFSSLLSKNLKIKVHRTLILPVVLYGCKSWLLTLREEHRLRVFENRVWRRIFGQGNGSGQKYTMRSLMICTPHPYCSGDKIENEMGRACSTSGEVERHIQGFSGET